MAVLGIDYGLRNIGVAVATGPLAQPLTTIRNSQGWISRVDKLVKDFRVTTIVIGVPDSGMLEEIRQAAAKLADMTKLPVVYEEETLTTHEARLSLRHRGQKARRKLEHAAAAALILQKYIDRHG